MNVRTESTLQRSCSHRLARLGVCSVVLAATSIFSIGPAHAQTGPLQEDPETGNVYQKVTRMQPVVEERIEQKQVTYYRPETVAVTRPELRTVYTPVTQMRWMPYVEGRWNPFRIPTVAYRQVPEMRWEARSEVVNRTSLDNRWVAENRTVNTPHRIVRNEARTEYRLVATGASRQTNRSNLDPKVASRLRPLDGPLVAGAPITRGPVTTVASNQVGSRTSDPARRSPMQAGMRTNDLRPNTFGSPLPAVTSGSNIATVPSFSRYR